MNKAIEINFPFEKIDAVAEKESYRKEINRPIYHTHKWWAQRLGSVFRAMVLGTVLDEDEDIWGAYYRQHNCQDKLILDPFMGSGTTIGEALKLGCKAVGCDINPVSTFIVSQAFKNIDVVKLVQEFKRLEKKVKPRIQQYYLKKHAETGESCQVLYFFWVKVVQIPDGKKIPLFSNYIFSKNAYPKKKPDAKIICPECWQINDGRFDSTELTCAHCGHSFNPQDGPANGQFVVDQKTGRKYKIMELVKASGHNPPEHRLYAAMVLKNNGTKEYLPVDENDLQLYQKAVEEAEKITTGFADSSIPMGHNTKQAINYNYTNWKDFFNPRQYLCLNILLEEILNIADVDLRSLFVSLFSGTLEFNNMFCSFKGEGTGAVRHLFSHHILKPERTPLENCIWGGDKSSGTFYSLFKSRLLKANEYLSKPFEIQASNGQVTKRYCNAPVQTAYVKDFAALKETANSCLVLNGDSSKLPLPDKSIDAIVTDPPYFDFVHYSELADFFYAWLKPALQDDIDYFRTENSRRSGEVQNREEEIFAQNLCKVFREGSRVLKDDGVMVFSFHHSRISGWLAIYRAITKAGFYIHEVYPVKAEMSVAAPKSASKSPINLDALMVCKKINSPTFKKENNSLESCYGHYIQRLNSVNRKLSIADKKVIYLSLLLKEASITKENEQRIFSTLNENHLEQVIADLDVEQQQSTSKEKEEYLTLFD